MSNNLRVEMQLLPDNYLDTSAISTIWQYYIVDQMTEQLLYVHKDEYYSAIAKKWEVSENQKRYVFHIDRNAKFSDGSPITSKEIAFTFKRLILRTGLHWKVSKYLQEADKLKTVNDSIKGIEIIDPYTVALNLKEPYITIMYVLSMTESGILSPKQINPADLSIKTWEVSSGAYTGKYENNTWLLKLNQHRIKVKRRPQMYENVTFMAINNFSSAETSLLSGKIDIMIPGSEYGIDTVKLLFSKKIQHTLGNYTTTEYIYLNISKPPFNDIALRRSIYKNWYNENLKIPDNRTELVMQADQLFLPTSPGRLDPDEIKRLTQNFKQHPATRQVNILCLVPPNYKEVPFYLNAFESILKKHNLNTKITIIPREEGLKRVLSNQYHLVFLGVSMTATEMNSVLSLLFSLKTLPLHDINKDIIPLIQGASQVTDRLEEGRINKEIARKLILNAEIIPTLYLKMPYFYRNGLDLSAMDKYDNDFHLWEIKQQSTSQSKH